jgi:hypothetical protein
VSLERFPTINISKIVKKSVYFSWKFLFAIKLILLDAGLFNDFLAP